MNREIDSDIIEPSIDPETKKIGVRSVKGLILAGQIQRLKSVTLTFSTQTSRLHWVALTRRQVHWKPHWQRSLVVMV